MKKIVAIGLTLLMVMSLSLTAFAEPGGFISSPSGTAAPELIDGKPEIHECTAKLVITPYSGRDTLSDAMRKQFEKAYKTIVESKDVTKLNADLAALAAKNGIPAGNLAVSDLFDISYIQCIIHGEHGYIKVTLKPEILKQFVGLMYFNGDKWELIEDAKVENDGQYLTFSIKEFGPFAIVLNTGDADIDSPPTGDNTNMMIYVIIMATSVLALIVIRRKSKKQSV